MVMFKARFQPSDKPNDGGRPRARANVQQQQQPQPTVPPIEKERGPQHPIREPGPGNPPERAR